jgi:hypothetical protein
MQRRPVTGIFVVEPGIMVFFALDRGVVRELWSGSSLPIGFCYWHKLRL